MSVVSNNWPILAAMVLYAVQAWLSYKAGSVGISLAFVFYALANIGLLLANEKI